MEEFEAHRGHLRAVAYRMLGSVTEADDAVQEAWLRLARTGPDGIGNLGGWLTTVVGRVCLDMLRARALRREHPWDFDEPEAAGPGPESEALLADSVGLALLVVLDALTPAERVAFVLHDTFGVPFDRIGAITGRSANAAKMLASRARQRVRGATEPEPDPARQRVAVEAFLAAAREGDLGALLAVLDPDVVARGGAVLVRGAERVAKRALVYGARAPRARLALVDGRAGIAVGAPSLVMVFGMRDGRIATVDIVTAPASLSKLDIRRP